MATKKHPSYAIKDGVLHSLNQSRYTPIKEGSAEHKKAIKYISETIGNEILGDNTKEKQQENLNKIIAEFEAGLMEFEEYKNRVVNPFNPTGTNPADGLPPLATPPAPTISEQVEEAKNVLMDVIDAQELALSRLRIRIMGYNLEPVNGHEPAEPEANKSGISLALYTINMRIKTALSQIEEINTFIDNNL